MNSPLRPFRVAFYLLLSSCPEAAHAALAGQAAPTPSDTTTITVGTLPLADIDRVVTRGPGSPFTYLVPTYQDQSYYTVYRPIPIGTDVPKGATASALRILNLGGNVVATNRSHVNLRFAFTGWNDILPSSTVTISLGSQTGTANHGATEFVFSDVPHTSLPLSITVNAATTTNGRPIPLIVPGLLPVTVDCPVAGTVRPRYLLLTVLYAPPGTAGGKGGSQVDYGTGSSTGTITSTANLFKEGLDVKAEAGGGLFASAQVTADFNTSKSTTDSNSIEVKKTSNRDFKVPGPAANGINHDYDLFVLWLNPLLNVSVDQTDAAQWQLGVDGTTMQVQPVYAAYLKDPTKMATDDPGLKADLDAAGLTSDDYQHILSTDPFVSGLTPIDPTRFLLVSGASFSYNPPMSASDSVQTSTYTQTNSVTTTATRSVQVSTEVSLGVSVTVGNPNLLHAKLTITGTLQWINTSSVGSSSGSSQSASFTIGGPSFGYQGPVDVVVYWDAVYNSFMFAFRNDEKK